MSEDTVGIKVTRKRGYTVVFNDLLPDDGSLSARAWGVYVYLLGRPPGWEARVSHLMTKFKEGRDALYTALGELCEHGLMRKESTIDGGMKRSRFVLDEEDAIANIRRSAPDTDSQDAGNPGPDSQDAGSPEPEKPGQVSKERTTTEGVTTETPTPGSAEGVAREKRDLNEGRDDVDRVCAHLSERLTALGVGHTVGKAWKDAARLLLDGTPTHEARTETQVHNMIRWCTNHQFWQANIHSMPTLRAQYDRLRLQALRDEGDNVRPITNRLDGGTGGEDERIAGAFNQG